MQKSYEMIPNSPKMLKLFNCIIVFSKVTFQILNFSSWSCSFNQNRTWKFSLLLLLFVSAQQAPLPVPANHSRTRPGTYLRPHSISARQGPLPGQLVQCRHRTVTPDPGLPYPESFMEASRSAGALSFSNEAVFLDPS